MARKKKKKNKACINIFFWLLVLGTLTFIGISLLYVRPHIFYPGFEISIPSGYQIHGIDVSRYQLKIDWEEVKNMESKSVRIGFAFIKATEGISKSDMQFARNWSEAGKHGIPKGAYHFYVPGRNAKMQAENFMRVVKVSPGDLPPVLDIERSGRLSAGQIRKDAFTWLTMIEEKYGITPIIYTNISYYERYFAKGFKRYPVWIAHYLQPSRPRTKRKWIFWQHSETGRVNGITGPVDFNVFNGDSTEFANILLK